MSKLDVIVRGGTVLDGTGGEPFTADIGIAGDKIVEVGAITSNAQQEIDAAGAKVIPGLVDIHTHYDGQATWSNRMNPSSHHGVTTVVMGNCGVGFAPVHAEHHGLLIELMEGVEDIPGTALHEGLPWAWESFPDYMDFLSAREFDVDIGAQLPHAALRVYVMGERGAAREEATASDMEKMRQLTAESIRAGALGFTSSRTLNHRSINGDPTPSLTAAQEELIAIGQGVADAGGAVLEMISDFKGFDEEFDILMSMVDAARSPMSISLAQGLNPNGWKKILAKIEQANRAGRVVRGQVAPRAIGVMNGLSCSRNPFSDNAVYKEVAELPLAERMTKLTDSSFRQRLLAEDQVNGSDRRFQKLYVVNESWDYEPHPESSVQAQAQARNISAAALAYDLMLQDEGRQLFYFPFANYTDNNLDCCREMILHPNTVMGLGDGGAHVGIICDASMVSYLLTHWGRDRTRGEKIDLATLVKAQTSDTAAAVGLGDRGLLKPGYKADLNIIDFDAMSVAKPYIVHDLPLGGARFEQKTEGILTTLLSGKQIAVNGEATDELPGRLLRGQRSV